MAKAKLSAFSKKEVHLAELAKALSHPARIRILNILVDKNICMTVSRQRLVDSKKLENKR